MRDLLVLLSARGWSCRVLCGPHLSLPAQPRIGAHLESLGLSPRQQSCPGGARPFTVHHVLTDGVPVAVYEADDGVDLSDLAAAHGLIALLEHSLEQDRPDLVLTYGGGWLGRSIIAAARRVGIPVVFWLRNCEYRQAAFFAPVTGVLVPSDFTRDHYRQSLGLDCTAIPSPIDWRRCRCESWRGEFLTFVNPQPAKGVFVFARIAAELATQKAQIPILVVEGRGSRGWLARAGIDAAAMSIKIVPPTPDPRQFLSETRVLLVPSVWAETFARTGVEAMINGIPVVASNRGGLPEHVTDSGLVLDIPPQYTETALRLPAPDEVRPWVSAIRRLWDDERFFQTQRQRALATAQRYTPERLGLMYDEYLDAMITRARTSPALPMTNTVAQTLAQQIPDPPARVRAQALRPEMLNVVM